MFTNLLFLILILLLIALAPPLIQGIGTPVESLIFSLWIYALLLVVIYTQNKLLVRFSKLRPKTTLLVLAHLEIFAFFISSYYFFGTQRIFETMPDSVFILVSLLFYFLALGLYHASSYRGFRLQLSPAIRELRLILPFALPFLLITFALDLLMKIPLLNELFKEESNPISQLVLIGLNIALLGLLLFFLPYAIQKIWLCKPLDKTALKERLEDLCQRAHFKHGGLKTWTILDHSLTAAIIGVMAPFRYVMFTKKMIQEMPPEMVEAVLAHEIGHNYRRHLLIYPLIMLGMAVVIGLFAEYLEPLIPPFWQRNNWYPILIFIPYVILIGLYFRFIFGLFSRLFERQADLHVFQLNVPPEHLIEALNYIGIATGNSHNQPNWHHYSIQQRIDFLRTATQFPEIIRKHHRLVKLVLAVYFFLLILGFLLLWW